MHRRQDRFLADWSSRLALLLVLGLAAGCGARPPAPAPTGTALPPSPPPAQAASTATITAGPTATIDGWLELLGHMPHPFGTPLPPSEPTALDGLYVKLDPKEGTAVPCKRCPDYAPEGGVWKLLFDRGVYRIYHPGTGWRSIGSYTVNANRVALFNDPVCLDTTGWYTWDRAEGELVLMPEADPCGINLRALNLSKQPWQSCHPPNTEAAVSGHWPVPPGCEPEGQ
jgi:hypothetical protein